MESLGEDEKVILVAHSSSGLAVSNFPRPWRYEISMISLYLEMGLVNLQHFPLEPTFLSLTMYDLSPKEDVELAVLLRRPQRLFNNVEIDTSLVLTPERFGSVNRVFDKSLVKDFQLWMIKNNPPNYVEYIQKSDHMA
ncbi:PREDICTED: methylesterase 1-like [Camelina sativa]|uniref:Methylesterase 1-like n=1 Tax=Camelina sativa TaxID=90675 RepID=A0ABM1RBL8_CAMSA|nr:PREDICTED: methylesterase 1-like [Camelina sativa]